MADSDEDSTALSDDNTAKAGGEPRKVVTEDTCPETASKSARLEAPEATGRTQVRLPNTLLVLSPMERHASTQLKGTDLLETFLLRIILASLRCKKDYLSKKSKRKGRSVPAPQVQRTVCRSFGACPKLYYKIMSSYLMDHSVHTSGAEGQGRAGNPLPRETRIPRTKAVTIALREFVQKERMNRKRVTASQLLDFFL
jgi:hypothetical protein